MRVRMGYPDSTSEHEILRSEAGAAQLEILKPVLSGEDVLGDCSAPSPKSKWMIRW